MQANNCRSHAYAVRYDSLGVDSPFWSLLAGLFQRLRTRFKSAFSLSVRPSVGRSDSPQKENDTRDFPLVRVATSPFSSPAPLSTASDLTCRLSSPFGEGEELSCRSRHSPLSHPSLTGGRLGEASSGRSILSSADTGSSAMVGSGPCCELSGSVMATSSSGGVIEPTSYQNVMINPTEDATSPTSCLYTPTWLLK